MDEENDQQGLAHFLEHMAFNGTKRFKPGELIAALESTGARLGPHVNAYTSFDETVYMFQLPTDKAGPGRKGLQALADFAGGMTPRSGGDRQGARRRHRGMARRARRRLAAARSADSGPLLRVQVRRASADRQAGGAQGVQAGTAARVLHEVVPPRPHGGRRRRRHRRSPRWRRWSRRSSARLPKPAAAAPDRDLRRAAADRAAGQGGDRSGSDAVVGLA